MRLLNKYVLREWLISFVAVLARMYILRGDFPSWSSSIFLRSVVIRVLVVSVIAAILPLAAHVMIPAGWTNFIVTGALSLLSAIVCILYLGCDKPERELIISKVKAGANNIKSKFIK